MFLSITSENKIFIIWTVALINFTNVEILKQ